MKEYELIFDRDKNIDKRDEYAFLPERIRKMRIIFADELLESLCAAQIESAKTVCSFEWVEEFINNFADKHKIPICIAAPDFEREMTTKYSSEEE